VRDESRWAARFDYRAVGSARDTQVSACSIIYGVVSRAELLLLDLLAAALTAKIVQRALLAITLLNISLQIQKHFFLRTDVSELGSLGGLQVSLTNLALAWLYLMWVVKTALRPSKASTVSGGARRSSRLIAFGGLLVVMYAVSMLVARDRQLAAFEVAYIVEQFLLLIYIAKTTASRDDVLFIVRVLLVGLIIQSTLMLAQVFGIVGDLDALGIKARAEFGGDPRVSGTIGSPNPAAAYLGLSMMLSLGVLLAASKRKDRWLAWTGLALSVLPLVFTQSRGGWIQLVVGIGILVVGGGRRLPLKTIACATVLLLVLMLPFRGAVLDRLYGDDKGSASSRIPMNQVALAIIEDHPVLGVGANNYAIAMQPYVAADFRNTVFYTVHNKFLLVFAETGPVGLLVFVAFLVAILREGWRAWRLSDPVLSPIALGCVAGAAGLIVQMNVEPARTDPYTHLIWLSGGLVLAMCRIAAESGAPSRAPVARPRRMQGRH
jgi:O-antigen ligase